MSYTYRGTTYYIQPRTNQLMMRGGVRPNGTYRKDRRVNETFFRSQVLQTYVAPPQRDENYGKMLSGLESLKITIGQVSHQHLSTSLFCFYSGVFGDFAHRAFIASVWVKVFWVNVGFFFGQYQVFFIDFSTF